MKKRNRNQRGSAITGLLSLTDSRRVKTVESPEEAPKETLRSFAAAEENRIASEKAAKVAAERARLAAAIYTTPSDELAVRIVPFDAAGRNVQQVQLAAQNAVAALKSALEADGIVLTDTGLRKMGTAAQHAGNALAFDTAAAWIELYKYMTELGCFDSADYLNLSDEPAVTEVKPEPVQDFDSLNDAEAKSAVMEATQMSVGQVAANFRASISRDFGYCMTQAELTYIARYLESHNLPYARDNSWHSARLSGIKAGVINPALIYPAERIAALAAEPSELSAAEERRMLNNELAKLRQ